MRKENVGPGRLHKRPCIIRLLPLGNRNRLGGRGQGRDTSIIRRRGWIDNTVSARPIGYVFIIIIPVPIGRVEDVDENVCHGGHKDQAQGDNEQDQIDVYHSKSLAARMLDCMVMASLLVSRDKTNLRMRA